MNYREILNTVHQQTIDERPEGAVATYIPELALVPPGKLGIHLKTIDGEDFSAGDSEERFSIQSIAKVFLLVRAMQEVGPDLRKRVGVEASGHLFNSLIQLEFEQGIPRNPFINAGALVVCDVLVSQLDDPKADFLAFVRKLSGSMEICYNDKITTSEFALSYRNRAIINMMKGFGNIHNDVETVLEFYITACSLSMTCRELAQGFSIFANEGKLLQSGEHILSEHRTKRVNAIMMTCGHYDEAGEFAFRVGLAGKSGVGGGIAAVHPGRYAVAVWSPPLNSKGNSSAGFRALELLTDLTETSIF